MDQNHSYFQKSQKPITQTEIDTVILYSHYDTIRLAYNLNNQMLYTITVPIER